MPSRLTSADRDRIERAGKSCDDIERQLAFLAEPPPRASLLRPCTPSRGILRLESAGDASDGSWRRALRAGRLSKFVPASGAATRMFGFLPEGLDSKITLADLEQLAARDDGAARGALAVLENLERFPFFADLAARATTDAGRPWTEMRRDRPLALLALMSGPGGLDLASRPKGLLPFHRYGDRCLSALAEHVAEAALYLADDEHRKMRLHLTVGEEQLDVFRSAAEEISAAPAIAALPEIEFSVQDPATDTVALDERGEPLRTADGHLAFRPGGHGSLLANLGRVAASGGDIVFIKNIDNVARARDHALGAEWKRLLAAHLLTLEHGCREHLDRLERNLDHAVEESAAFLSAGFALRLPAALSSWDRARQDGYLRQRLDRPLRVCGVVQNRDEPGGGPFWVGRDDGSEEGQIVEGSQVDLGDSAQRSIWEASSHFNPVDIVCSLRDRHGSPFELASFVDHSTAFVSDKTIDGRLIRVLERPGLWNGAMAGWNTCFVEVPEETFTPVKTILDLLRPAHQPRSASAPRAGR